MAAVLAMLASAQFSPATLTVRQHVSVEHPLAGSMM
jgi:hypothetical protein